MIKPQDKSDFEFSLTNGNRFEKTYSVLDDHVIVTFTVPSKATISLILDQIEKDREKGLTRTSIRRKAQDYQLACYTKSLSVNGSTLVFPEPDIEAQLDSDIDLPSLAIRFDFLPEPVYNILCSYLEQFKSLLEELQKELLAPQNELEQLVDRFKERLAERAQTRSAQP